LNCLGSNKISDARRRREIKFGIVIATAGFKKMQKERKRKRKMRRKAEN